KTKLSVLYEFEKNYLQLISDYKEEIKFASSLQEDLRKERAKFFSETLKEVHQTLSESQVDNEVASKWIKELVCSYTKSLDLSGGLVEEHTLD
ncbi:nickel transporter, partial [Escherichia coli]|nr:nickel transporter [Escherichia coli]